MNERERQHDQREQPQSSGTPPANTLGEIGDTVSRLLAAGDAAIERALSNDSTAFLRGIRQHGGQ